MAENEKCTAVYSRSPRNLEFGHFTVPRMFADDTNLTLSVKTLTEFKLALTPELNNLSCWLKAKLSINVAKTELMIIGSRQRLSAQCDDVENRIDYQESR